MALALFHKLFSRLRRGPAWTAEERAYVHEWARRREAFEAAIVLRVGTFMGSVLWLFGLSSAPEIHRVMVLGVGAVALSLICGAVVGKRSRLDIRLVAYVVQIICMLSLVALGRYAAVTLVSPVRAALAPSIFLMPITGMLLLCPFDFRGALALGCLSIAAIATAFSGLNLPLVVIATMIVVLFMTLKALIRHLFLRGAAAEYRARIALVPASVARRSIGRDDPAALAFAPCDRDCICISTDLSDYDLVLGNEGLTTLTPYLRHVYTRTDRLLRGYFPAGNYCADWIAGELFIVVFAEGGTLPPEAVAAAFGFARELLIDGGRAVTSSIGVSAGTAYVGLMGPPGNRKATALGEVAGRARRLSQGSVLVTRHTAGAPVVVFGGDVLKRLPASLAAAVAGAVPLEDTERLRDLDDRQIYYARASDGRDAA